MIAVAAPAGPSAAAASSSAPAAAVPSATQPQWRLAPAPGSIVLVRITRVQQTSASGNVIGIDGVWCQRGFKGTVKADDAKQVSAKDVAAGLGVKHMSECFRAGDIVQARVIALAEARSFQLSTTDPTCGVVRGYAVPATATDVARFAEGGDAAVGVSARRPLAQVPGRRDVMRIVPSSSFAAAADSAEQESMMVKRWAPAYPVTLV
jgi:exosome complex component CSL4